MTHLLLRQFLLEWKLFSRDRVALFWSVAFPLLLLGGFGLMFRPGKGPMLRLVVVEIPGTPTLAPDLETALRASGLALERMPPAEAEAAWRRGRTAAQVEPGPGGLRVRVNAYLLAQGQTAAGLAREADLKVQVQRRGAQVQELPVSVETPGHGRTGTYVAFLLPGLMGMNLLSMGLFSVGMVNVSYREKGKFRRLAVTPLPKWVFLLGQILQRLTLVAAQSALMLGAAAALFGIANQGSYAALALVMALGTGCFMAMGFALASFARTSESYAALSNAFFFPMMLLSGVYFTLDSAPLWLQRAVIVLPLSPYLRALRAVFNDGATLVSQGPGLALVALWTLLAFGVAIRRFSWA